jgi:lysosomal alpha-mannosidase
MMLEHYYSPGGFLFEVNNNNDQIFIDKRTSFFNGDEKAMDFLADLEKRAEIYRSKDILVVMGSDFGFMDAFWNFQQIDDLIAYVNEHHGDKFHLKYSTPSVYVDAIAA